MRAKSVVWNLRMQHLIQIGAALSLVFAAPGSAWPQARSAQQSVTPNYKEILKVINETANAICTTVPTQGSKSDLQLSADAKAKLAGAVGKVADLGGEAAAGYESEKYQGVLQRDLAAAIKSGNDCRSNVFDKLEEKLLPPPPPVSTGPKVALDNGVYAHHQKTRINRDANCYFNDTNRWQVWADKGQLTLVVVVGHFGNDDCKAEFFQCESRLTIVPTPSSPNLQSGFEFYTVAAEGDRDRSTGLSKAEIQPATGSHESNTPELLARCAGIGKLPAVGFKGRLTGESATELRLKGGEPDTNLVLTKEAETH